MSRYRGPVTRISRRLGLMLFTNGESKIKAYNKKRYKPGEHGQKHFAQLSEYSKHLQEKQKAKGLFGINERQCKRYYALATKTNEATGIKFMELLEQRLDNVIFRAGLASTRTQARQMVSHGLIKLNNKKVKTPSIQTKPGDIFEVKEKRKDSPLFEKIKKSKNRTPKWIRSDLSALKGEVIAFPDKDDIEQGINNQLITEFYSK